MKKYNYVLRHRIIRKQEIVYTMGEKCQLCGYDKCIQALECHHIIPSEKDTDFKNLCQNWEKIRLELEKCILVCANCHREIHTNILKYKDLKSSFIKERADEISLKLNKLKTHKTRHCINCGAIISFNAKRCLKCHSYFQRKVERPSYEQLLNDRKTMTFSAMGIKYNVSSTAIRKWIKKYKDMEG